MSTDAEPDHDDDFSWLDDAACANRPLDWFFPPPNDPTDRWMGGIAVCGTCPVLEQCRDWMSSHQKIKMGLQTGTWAGVTASQRRQRRHPSARRGNRKKHAAGSHQAETAGSS